MTKITVDKALIEQALQQLNLLDGGAGVCESAHHVKGHQHTSREPCPIDKLHQDAIAALRASLAEPAVETDDPLHCDLCGDATDDPWHFSTSQDRHKHACDQCGESLKESDTICKPPAETVVDPVAEVYQRMTGGNSFPGTGIRWLDGVGLIPTGTKLYAAPPPPAEVPLLTTDEYTTLAHRIASQYAHRSDPQHIAYTFLPHTLEQFARAIEQAVRQNAGLK